MPVPKRKHSRARRDSKHACKFIRPQAITLCAQCAAPINTHAACAECGFYKGKKVMRTKLERALKRGEVAQKAKVRQQAAQTAGGQTDHEPAQEK